MMSDSGAVIYLCTMEITVSRSDALPLYQQIVSRIRFYIAAQLYYPGEELPSTRVAAKEWGVHYHTVRKAYHELAKAGLVCRKPPELTYVSFEICNFRPSTGQRHVFIAKVLHDANYLFGLNPEGLCKKIEEWAEKDTEVPPWPESVGQDGRTDQTSSGHSKGQGFPR